MAAVRIVTDSSCDLTDEQAEALGIQIVPLKIRFGDEEFVDREELSTIDFYKKLAASEALPETAAPPPGAFEAVFRRAAEDGADGVVCVNISSELSATMQSAQAAATSVSDAIDVRVIDSKSITAGLGSQAAVLAERANDGASLDDLVTLSADLIDRTRVYGALDTLEYLKKGGRISGAQAAIGTLLSVKPIITIRDGLVHTADKPRTAGKARARVTELLTQRPIERLAVLYTPPADGEAFMGELVDRLGGSVDAANVSIQPVGSSVGPHLGPGCLGGVVLYRR
jgi:DegV family protein with EDD domain